MHKINKFSTFLLSISRSDWLLKFVYRAASIQVGDIAGLGPIELSWPRMKNIDLGEIVSGILFLALVLFIQAYKLNPTSQKWRFYLTSRCTRITLTRMKWILWKQRMKDTLNCIERCDVVSHLNGWKGRWLCPFK